MEQPDNSGFGKAIVIVFLLIWTLGSAGMSIMFLGDSFAAPAPFGGVSGGPPWFMAVVPIGFTVLGLMMLIKVATLKAMPMTPETTRDIARDVPSPIVAPPPIPVPLTCPGCGSRKNPPGSTMCAHCGGTLTSGLA